MKRIFLALLIVLAFSSSAFAVGSVRQDLREYGCFREITMSWTADAAAGTVPATATTWPINGWILKVTTNPGTTAPTDNYDITLTDRDGFDVMNGLLVDRDTANTEAVYPTITQGAVTYLAPNGVPVLGKVTMNLTNNSVNSAVGDVVILTYKNDCALP